jgi:glycosyltransferase involved in cell wall biosynthesis
MIDAKDRPHSPRISVVIPAKNEARNLEIILPQLPEVYEVILVDGKSVDGTVETAKRVMPSIRVLHQSRKGKGNALAAGFAAATGDIIVMFDADGSADPSEIERFTQALVAGADFAKGSRFCRGGGSADITRFRRVGNKGLNMFANVLLRTRYTDLCYGFNAFWTDVRHHLGLPPHDIRAINGAMLWGDGFEIETIINCRIAHAKLNIVEVASYEKVRIHGESNLNAVKDGLRVLKTLIYERSHARSMAHRQRITDSARRAHADAKEAALYVASEEIA